MSLLWLTGQLGIVLEVFGAGYIVYSAFRSKKHICDLGSSIGEISQTVNSLIKVISSQFRNELIGFFLLGVGLVLQFVGGFVY